ncbi:MAG TPA: hypothetical protein VLR92_05555, partial [Blastocatellia bacterium]|nr:hypothetical protein [Blastocatellia bacterium]
VHAARYNTDTSKILRKESMVLSRVFYAVPAHQELAENSSAARSKPQRLKAALIMLELRHE